MFAIESAQQNPTTEFILSPERDDLNRLIIVTGVTGAGKDYLIRSAMDKTGIRVTKLSFGTLLSDQLEADRDDLKFENQTEIAQAQLKVINTILSQLPALLDSHIVTKHGDLLITNPSLEKTLRPAIYVVIIAEPEQIHQWRTMRNKTGTRRSIEEDVDSIAFHQRQLLTTVQNYAQLLGSRVVVIYNTPDTTNDNTDYLTKLIEEL